MVLHCCVGLGPAGETASLVMLHPLGQHARTVICFEQQKGAERTDIQDHAVIVVVVTHLCSSMITSIMQPHSAAPACRAKTK